MLGIINLNYFRVYLALVRRDLLVIKQRLRGAFMDSSVQLAMHILLYGNLLPIMGMSSALIAPLFIGSQANSMFFLGMGFGIRTLFDIKFSHFIDYRITLPLPKRWMFASYITYFVIEGLIITGPLLTLGIIMLGSSFRMVAPNIPLFILTYIMSLTLYGLLFLGFSLYYQFDWFMENLWPRRLTFLFSFSPVFTVWKQVNSFAPGLAKIMLFSPLTYSCEGLRATLIGGPQYIPAYVCIPMLALWIGLGTLFVARGISKRLDPV